MTTYQKAAFILSTALGIIGTEDKYHPAECKNSDHRKVYFDDPACVRWDAAGAIFKASGISHTATEHPVELYAAGLAWRATKPDFLPEQVKHCTFEEVRSWLTDAMKFLQLVVPEDAPGDTSMEVVAVVTALCSPKSSEEAS